MSEKPILDFPGQAIDVRFDGRLCIHAAECGTARGALFVAGREPWCTPDAVTTAEAREIVERCPTGALTYTEKDGPPEAAPSENTLLVSNDGPLYLTGDLDIAGAPADQPGVRRRAALCRCGASANKPFCDGSHQAAEFHDAGAIGERGPGLTATGDILRVETRRNGPLVLTGNLSMRAGSGRLAWQGAQAFLCRCGASANKPFCDGSHKAAGFEAE